MRKCGCEVLQLPLCLCSSHLSYIVHHLLALISPFNIWYWPDGELSVLQRMVRFTHICLLCVTVLATGEEHNHLEPGIPDQVSLHIHLYPHLHLHFHL